MEQKPEPDPKQPGPIVSPSLGEQRLTLGAIGSVGLKVAAGEAPGLGFEAVVGITGRPPANQFARPAAAVGLGPAPAGAWPPGRPLEVVHVGPCLYRGGAEIWLDQLARFLDPARVRIVRSIATRPDLVDPAFASSLPVPYETGDAAAVRRAAAGCDALLCWGIALDELLGAHGPKLPTLCVGIAHGEGDFTRQQIAHSRRYLDHVVAVSPAAERGACAGLGVPTSVVPNGVDTARLAWTMPRDQARATLGFAPGDCVVGYVGRLSPEKRIDLVLDALAGLPPRFKGLVVGWGPLLPDLLAHANRVMPGRCVFRSASSYLGDAYRAMDAFCSPSESEGTPLTLLEAMFCGVPTVVTDVGAVPDLVLDRVNGQVVEPTTASIRHALTRLADHPRWARGLAEEGRATADRHGHAAPMARGYEQVLGRLWALRHRGG